MPFIKKSFALIILTILISASLLYTDYAFAKTDPKDLFDKGLKYSQDNNTKKAKKYFISTTKTSRDHYPSYFNLSLLYLKDKDYKKGLKYIEAAKRLNPFDIRISKMLSSTYLMLGNTEAAKKISTELLSKNPADINSHKKLGIIYLKTKNNKSAIAQTTLLRNLAPSDPSYILLSSASHFLNNEYAKSYKKIKNIKEKLEDNAPLAFYALVLEKNNLNDSAKKIFDTISVHNKETITDDLLSYLEKITVENEIKQLALINRFENPEVVKRMSDNLKQEAKINSTTTLNNRKEASRPLKLKGTLTETIEHYDRNPAASSPINSLNVTSNLKLEGKTTNGVDLTAELEGYFNRWDNGNLDFYKINATKKNDYEIDLGKFSTKHFGTLVSFPTVLDGIRVWKKITLPEFVPTQASEIGSDSFAPVNLGEIYRENYIDSRANKAVELTVVVGRTLHSKNIDDRKNKNENSYETSGQFEQWTQSYRLHTEVNSVLELGSSLSLTRDRSSNATVSSTTYPTDSIAIGLDGGIDLMDDDLNIDIEIAYSNYDENTIDVETKHLRDLAWLIKSKYKIFDTLSFSYEQKAIGRSFKVEGASQTQDKTSHTIDLIYKPKNPKTWFIQSQTFNFKPEITGPDGGGSNKKRYRTFQSVTDFKLPQNAKYTIDYKYYRELAKCDCTNYKTATMKNCIEWTIPSWKTTIKPSYTFERKNDMLSSQTDEKKKEYVFTIENKSIDNLELDYSFEREKKKYWGVTTKSYVQYIHSFEAKYTFIPSRMDTKIKVAQDFKDPSDTNKTDITTLTFEFNYTSKDSDDKFELKYERKNNIYMPWSDSSAYRQNYVKLKYTHKF